MKKLSTTAIALWLGVAGILRAQNTPELLYYNFEGSGTKVPNLASAPPAGTDTANILGAITQGSSSFLCGGVLMGSGNSSGSDYLNTGWNTELSNISWTISFRTNQISANATLYYIFGDANAGSFRCFTNGVAGSNNWILRGTGITDVLVNGGALTTSTMTTFVYDQPANTIYGYLNGALVTTVPQSATPVITSSGGPFKVMGYATNVGAPSGGLLDEFRVYNRALSAAEIAQLYNPYATPGFLGPDQAICPSDGAVQFDLPYPVSAGSVTWSNGITMPALTVTTPDTFSVNISGDCGSGSDTIIFNSLESSASFAATACVPEGYTSPGGAVYTTSGIYTDTIPNAAGCDSILTITLTVNSVDTTVSMTLSVPPQLVAAAGATSYQWYDCNNQMLVPGATSQNFSPGLNGDFAVIITANGCTDTSGCRSYYYFGLENALSASLKLYPNPTTGSFRIEAAENKEMLQLELINSVGQVLQDLRMNGENTVLNIEGAKGLYFVRVTNAAGEKAVLRIIKE
ncbi:MAG: T9SS type A sorting domain-containing protein [Bacteroidia bacterium]|nr:T9SS type A sorting domain-containing protein [Bacteroidia bacterium]